jgi:hypothetical protein
MAQEMMVKKYDLAKEQLNDNQRRESEAFFQSWEEWRDVKRSQYNVKLGSVTNRQIVVETKSEQATKPRDDSLDIICKGPPDAAPIKVSPIEPKVLPPLVPPNDPKVHDWKQRRRITQQEKNKKFREAQEQKAKEEQRSEMNSPRSSGETSWYSSPFHRRAIKSGVQLRNERESAPPPLSDSEDSVDEGDVAVGHDQEDIRIGHEEEDIQGTTGEEDIRIGDGDSEEPGVEDVIKDALREPAGGGEESHEPGVGDVIKDALAEAGEESGVHVEDVVSGALTQADEGVQESGIHIEDVISGTLTEAGEEGGESGVHVEDVIATTITAPAIPDVVDSTTFPLTQSESVE